MAELMGNSTLKGAHKRKNAKRAVREVGNVVYFGRQGKKDLWWR